MSEIDIGAAEWYLDPNEVEQKVGDMKQLVDGTVEQYPHLPGLRNKLDEQLYKSSSALRLTAQQETQKLVEDQVSSKLQQVAGQYGYQGKFQDVYMGMVEVVAPFATALGGPDKARDLLTKNYDAYFKLHYGTIANYPNRDNIKLLQEAILNPDMQSIISPETMAGAIKTQKQMTAALNTTGTPSEYAQRIEALKHMDKYRKDHNMSPMDNQARLDFIQFGTRDKADPSKLSKKEERDELLKWADPKGNILPKEIVMHYKLEGKIPDNVDTKIDARKAKIDKMNEERVAAGLPKYSARIYDHFVLGGVLLDDSPLEKSRAEIAFIQTSVEKGGLGLVLDDVQKKQIIAKNYKLSAGESADFKVEEVTDILNANTKEGAKPVRPTQPQLEKVAGVAERKPLVTITGDEVESEYSKTVGKELGKSSASIAALKGRAIENMDRLASMEALLDTDEFKPGALARPRLFIGRFAEFIHDMHPSAATKQFIEAVGTPAFGETYDKISKEMLLIMAKYVGRITNLSLTFARDTVPGLLKTKAGNLLIIALMRRAAQRDIDLGTLEEKYMLLGTPTPKGELSLFAARDKYRKDNPFLNDELKEAIAIARQTLPKDLKNALSPKNLRNIVTDPPKASNKAFQAYLKKYDIKLPYGTQYSGTVNGFHQYVHPDGTGTDIPIYWDDKKSTPMAGKGHWEPSTPPEIKKPPLTLDTLGDITLDQIMNTSPEEVEKFFTQNENDIRKIVPDDIVDEIVEIANEVRKP